MKDPAKQYPTQFALSAQSTAARSVAGGAGKEELMKKLAMKVIDTRSLLSRNGEEVRHV